MKVYALIGPSGTGKSYHVPHLAQKYKIDCIIDDGLLISGGELSLVARQKRRLTKLGQLK